MPKFLLILMVRMAIPKSKDRMVILLASPKNHVKQIVDILDCARQQGAIKLAILKTS